MISQPNLCALPLFAALSPATLDALSASMTVEEQPEGAVLATPKEPPRALQVVLSGRLATTRDGVTTPAIPGAWVGEEAVLLGPRRHERIVVAERARLGCLTRAAFDQVFRAQLDAGLEGPGRQYLAVEERIPVASEAPGIGLALSSGGALAIAHLGVLRCLIRAGISVAAVAGSSGGALFGALYCRGLALDRIIEFAGELSRLVRRRGGLWDFAKPPVTGLIRGDLTTRLYEEALSTVQFADLTTPLQVIATDLVSGTAVTLDSGSVAAAVRASMGVPGVYEPCRVGDALLVDGGFSDPTGIGAPILGQCWLRIASVTLDDPDELGVLAPPLAGPHLLDLVTARANSLLDHLPASAFQPAGDLVIRPDLTGFSVLDYGRAEELIAAGEAAAEARIADLLRKLQARRPE